MLVRASHNPTSLSLSSFFQQPTATQNTKTEKLKRKWRVEIRFFTFYFHTQNTNSPQYRMLKRSLKPLARLASASSSSSFLSSSRFVLELFLQAIENFFREESAVFRHLQSSSFLFHHTKKIQITSSGMLVALRHFRVSSKVSSRSFYRVPVPMKRLVLLHKL